MKVFVLSVYASLEIFYEDQFGCCRTEPDFHQENSKVKAIYENEEDALKALEEYDVSEKWHEKHGYRKWNDNTHKLKSEKGPEGWERFVYFRKDDYDEYENAEAHEYEDYIITVAEMPVI